MQKEQAEQTDGQDWQNNMIGQTDRPGWWNAPRRAECACRAQYLTCQASLNLIGQTRAHAQRGDLPAKGEQENKGNYSLGYLN